MIPYRHTIRPKGTPGFTLIEVLGAVAVLAILYTVLATVAIQALRAEGESRRRMEASLLAGERLAVLERSGGAPPAGEESEEVDIYTVETRVRGFDPTQLGFGDDPENDEALAFLSGSPGGSADSPIREIEILVHWSEGDRDLEVQRTTYALDTASLSGSFSGAGDGGAGLDGLDGEDGDGTGSDSGSRASGRGRRSGNTGGSSSDRQNSAPVDCDRPCSAGDVDCLIRQLGACS